MKFRWLVLESVYGEKSLKTDPVLQYSEGYRWITVPTQIVKSHDATCTHIEHTQDTISKPVTGDA